MTNAIGDRYWTDGSHPVLGLTGETVFAETKSAIEDLGRGGSSYPGLRSYIVRLLAVDRGIAELAIYEAERDGGQPRAIANARFALSQGDQQVRLGSKLRAVDHYRDAWKFATRSTTLPM